MLIYRVSSDGGARDDTPHYHAGIPNMYYPVARCGASPAGAKADGIARMAWVGDVLPTASDGGIVQRWIMSV